MTPSIISPKMSAVQAEQMLDRLTEDAAHMTAPQNANHNLVRDAFAAAHARNRRSKNLTFVVGATILLAAAGVFLFLQPSTLPLTTMTLATGDVIVSEAESAFRVLESNDRHRLIRVESGSVLFDVRPLDGDTDFVVEAGDAIVRVRGTVFSVRLLDGDIQVVVYEGQVETQCRGRRQLLSQGSRFSTRSGPLTNGGVSAGLDRAGQRYAQARLRSVEENTSSSVADGADANSANRNTAPAASAVMPLDEGSSRTQSEQERDPTSASNGPVVGSAAPATLAEIRASIADGAFDRARRQLGTIDRRRRSAESWLLEADVDRAEGLNARAARNYERAIAGLRGNERASVGYLAARLWHQLGDRPRAQRVLERSGALSLSSPVRSDALRLSEAAPF